MVKNEMLKSDMEEYASNKNDRELGCVIYGESIWEGAIMTSIDLIKEALDEADSYISEDKALIKYPFSKIDWDKFQLDCWLYPIDDSNGNTLYSKDELDDILKAIEMGVESNYLTAEEVELKSGIGKDMLDQMDRMEAIGAMKLDSGVWLYGKAGIQNAINDIFSKPHDGIHC